jgi:hypothetical protein
VNVLWKAAHGLSVKAGYSRNTQFIGLLSNSVSPFNSLEVWVPCGPNIMPQIVDQVSVGLGKESINRSWSLSIEGYYKWFRDRLDFRDHPNLLFNTLIEGELRFGNGFSYGIETVIRKQSGHVSGWISYTWSRAMLRTPGYNRDEYYPADNDRPHAVTLNIAYDDQKHWLLAANWIFMSGNPFSMPVGFIKINGYTIPVYGDRNNARLPDYHRLDLMASYTINPPGSRYRHSISMTLYNAYARQNPFSLNFNKTQNQESQYVVPSNLFVTNVLIPTWFSVAGIIPSINYQFKF